MNNVRASVTHVYRGCGALVLPPIIIRVFAYRSYFSALANAAENMADVNTATKAS